MTSASVMCLMGNRNVYCNAPVCVFPIRQLQKTSATVDSRLKYLTGEWFYEAKSLRHREKIHGSEVILASMKQRKAGSLGGSKTQFKH